MKDSFWSISNAYLVKNIFSFFEKTQKTPEKVLKITLIQTLKIKKGSVYRCLFLNNA